MSMIKKVQSKINVILSMHNCGILVNYDIAHPLLKRNDKREESLIIKSPIQESFQVNYLEDNEDEEIYFSMKQENIKNINTAKSLINELLIKYNCTIISSYDYSNVFIFDSFGNKISLN